MSNTIIERLNKTFNSDIKRLTEKHKDHLVRVQKLLDWAKENNIPLDAKEMLWSDVKVNGVDCKLTSVDMSSYPLFNSEVVVRPLSLSDDVGNGAGNAKTINF
jgi:hypothetical protein